MPETVSGTYSDTDLMRIGIEVAKRYRAQSGGTRTPTELVVEVLRPYEKTMTDQHVRRVCEHAYHALYKSGHADGKPGTETQKYVVFEPPDAPTVIGQLKVRHVSTISPNEKPQKTGYPGATTMSKKASSTHMAAPRPLVIDAAALDITVRPTFRIDADALQKQANATSAAAIDALHADVMQRRANVAAAAEALPPGELLKAANIAYDDVAEIVRRGQARVDAGISSIVKAAGAYCAQAPSQDVFRLIAEGMAPHAATSDVCLTALQAIANDLHQTHPFSKTAGDVREVNPNHPLVKAAAQLGEQIIDLQRYATALGLLIDQRDVYRRDVQSEARAEREMSKSASLVTSPLQKGLQRTVNASGYGLLGMGSGVTTRDRKADLRTAEERGKAQFRGGVAGTVVGGVVGSFSREVSEAVRDGVTKMLSANGKPLSPVAGTIVSLASHVAPSALASVAAHGAARAAHLTVGKNGVPVSHVAPPTQEAGMPQAAPTTLTNLHNSSKQANSVKIPSWVRYQPADREALQHALDTGEVSLGDMILSADDEYSYGQKHALIQEYAQKQFGKEFKALTRDQQHKVLLATHPGYTEIHRTEPGHALFAWDRPKHPITKAAPVAKKTASSSESNPYRQSIADSGGSQTSGVYKIPESFRDAFEVPAGQDGWYAFNAAELSAMKAAGVTLEEAPEDIRADYARQIYGLPSTHVDTPAPPATKEASAPIEAVSETLDALQRVTHSMRQIAQPHGVPGMMPKQAMAFQNMANNFVQAMQHGMQTGAELGKTNVANAFKGVLDSRAGQRVGGLATTGYAASAGLPALKQIPEGFSSARQGILHPNLQ
jgi:hypothetical protein